MGAPVFYGIEKGATLNSFASQPYVSITWRQPESGTFYYRLWCVADGLPTIALYLGAYNTNPAYNYSANLKVIDVKKAEGSTLSNYSFQQLFEAFPDRTAFRYTAYLHASTNNSFSSYGVSAASKILDISLNLNSTAFMPTWQIPTHIDTKYADSTGIQTLTGSDQKGVQNESLFKFTLATATSKYGATNKTYKISTNTGIYYAYPAANIEYNPNVFINLENYPKVSGDVVFTFSVEDSRGFTRSYKKTITIVPYSKIELTQNNTHRQGGTGQTVILDFAGQWHGSPLTLTCEGITAYEQGSITPFATLTPAVTVTGNAFSYQDDWSGVSFDRSKAYTITAVFTDSVSTAELTLSIPVGTPVITVRNQKVGINNANPQTELDVIGTIQQNGFPVMAYMGEIGTATECNLNDYTTTGYYLYKGNSATLVNFPSGSTANIPKLLKVINVDGYITQTLTEIQSSAPEHRRACNNSQWYYWS